MDESDTSYLNGAWNAMNYTSAFEVDKANVYLTPDYSVLQGLFLPDMTRHEALVSIVNKVQEHNAWMSQLKRNALQISRSLLALRATHNSLLLIRQLPDEVLAHIFVFASGVSLRIDTMRSSDCVRLTHVCRYWRNVALATPRLWCTIHFQHLDQTVAFLRRSKMAPLDLSILSLDSGRKGAQMLKLIRENLHHTRRMKIVFVEGGWDRIRPLLTESAPLLEEFLLSGRPDNLIVQTFFGDKTPALRRVTLSNVYVPWDSGMFSTSLTHLSAMWQGPGPTLERFLEILRTCVQVTELVIQRQEPPTDSSFSLIPTTVIPPVRMPLLRTLRLDRVFKDAEYLLSHLITPSSIRVLWHCDDLGHFPKFSDLLPRDVSSLGAFVGILSLAFDVLSYTILLRCGHTSSAPSFNVPTRLEFRIQHSGLPPLAHLQIFMDIGRAFPLPLLQTLSVANTTEVISESSWRHVLVALPALRNLYLRSGNLLPLLEALRKLAATRCNLNQSTIDALLQCLHIRSSARVPLHIVEFSRCIVGMSVVIRGHAGSNNYVDQLRTHVPGRIRKITLNLRESQEPEQHSSSSVDPAM